MLRTLRLAVVSLLTASIVAGCQVNPATGRAQLRLVPSEQVAQLGNEARPQLIEEYGGEVPETALREYIDEIGNRLAQHVEPAFADIEWTFTVLDSDVINAFALPGGNVFISRGLLARFDNEAQVAGVLGHEIGHVTGRHVDERISQAVSVEVGLGLLGALTESQIARVAAQIATGGYQLSFSRSQESEADELGVRYMVGAGYDPQGMLEVLRVLQEATQNAAPPEFLSTHPHPDTRIRTVTRLVERDYAHTQDNPEYRKFEDRFQQQAAPHLAPRTAAANHAPTLAAAGVWCAHCRQAH